MRFIFIHWMTKHQLLSTILNKNIGNILDIFAFGQKPAKFRVCFHYNPPHHQHFLPILFWTFTITCSLGSKVNLILVTNGFKTWRKCKFNIRLEFPYINYLIFASFALKRRVYTSSLSMRFIHCTTSINVVFSYEPIQLHPKRVAIQKPHALLGCGNVALREGKMVRK